MKKLVLLIATLVFFAPFVSAQETVFFNGGSPDGMTTWAWAFTDGGAVETPVPNIGYSPGTSALKWGIYDDMGWQGIMVLLTDYSTGIDMSSIWETDSVYFKLRAPAGLDPADPNLNLGLYDPTNDMMDWGTMVFYELDNFQDLDDGNWHQFAVALMDLFPMYELIDETNVVGVSFEYFDTGIDTEILIDEVWIGNADVSQKMTIFNGNEVAPNLSSYYRWGFQDDTFEIGEGEGFTPGTNAMVWENNQDVYGGLGFEFPTHDMTYSWTVDTVKLKVNAPAGINDLMLVWWDNNWSTSTFVIDASVVTWDGTWKSLEIPISDFTGDGYFDQTIVYALCIQPATDPIPERILFDDFWIGNPGIDITAPPAPQNIIADVSTPYINLISWDNIDTETGETYDVYASRDPITDLDVPGVYLVDVDVPEGDVGVHNIFYPLADGEVSYYYAVTCTDPAGNSSETFGTSNDAFTNTGEERAIISLEPPATFTADGNIDEWSHIVPFSMNPDDNLFTGTIDDSFDYSAFCYVAMDAQNLYVAFDVFDDVFSWQEENTIDWWDDECIEFYFGLYELGVPHPALESGDEPDYRLVFTPNDLLWGNGESLAIASENYYFQPLGNSDYVIEACIPFSLIQDEADAPFIPTEGMTIPFEIFAADADVPDGGNESRLQFGDDPTLNPWGEGPDAWTFAWIGMPDLTSVDEPVKTVVENYALHDNFPNPFNPTTTITYSIPENGDVELTIFNSLGRIITTMEYSSQSIGRYTVNFDGSGLASGIYFYRIQVNHFTQLKKMVLLK